jgi:predicted flavoprotein YhiN
VQTCPIRSIRGFFVDTQMKHVIIGSGAAGVVAAETLRKADPAAEIAINSATETEKRLR